MIQWFEPFGSNQEEWRKVIVARSKTAKTRMNKGGIGERLIESEERREKLCERRWNLKNEVEKVGEKLETQTMKWTMDQRNPREFWGGSRKFTKERKAQEHKLISLKRNSCLLAAKRRNTKRSVSAPELRVQKDWASREGLAENCLTSRRELRVAQISRGLEGHLATANKLWTNSRGCVEANGSHRTKYGFRAVFCFYPWA